MTDDKEFSFTIEATREVSVVAPNPETAEEQVKENMNGEVKTIVTEKTAITQLNGPTATLEFVGQQKLHNMMGRVTDPIHFEIPLKDILIPEEGRLFPNRSHSLDSQKTHIRAPLTVRTWSGPFTLTINEIHYTDREELNEYILNECEREEIHDLTDLIPPELLSEDNQPDQTDI